MNFSVESYDQLSKSVQFFRISIGILAIVEITSLLFDYNIFFGGSNSLFPTALKYLYSEYFFFYNYISTSTSLFDYYHIAIAIYIAALILMVSGIKTRLTAIVALLLQLYIFRSISVFNYGYDQFMTSSLFYIVLFPTSQAINTNSVKFNYSLFLKAHLCIAYFIAGIAKFADPEWLNGLAIWRAVASIRNNLYDTPYQIFIILGIGTVLLETLYPLLMNIRHTKNYALISIIMMHLGIGFVLNLYAFATIMIIWNIAAWYKWEE